MEVFKKCFADNGDSCSALKKKDCKNCKFYRTDLNRLLIEAEINRYGGSNNENL